MVGELDIATSPDLRDLLADSEGTVDGPIVIDLTECGFIDSTGSRDAPAWSGPRAERARDGSPW